MECYDTMDGMRQEREMGAIGFLDETMKLC